MKRGSETLEKIYTVQIMKLQHMPPRLANPRRGHKQTLTRTHRIVQERTEWIKEGYRKGTGRVQSLWKGRTLAGAKAINVFCADRE